MTSFSIGDQGCSVRLDEPSDSTYTRRPPPGNSAAPTKQQSYGPLKDLTDLAAMPSEHGPGKFVLPSRVIAVRDCMRDRSNARPTSANGPLRKRRNGESHKSCEVKGQDIEATRSQNEKSNPPYQIKAGLSKMAEFGLRGHLIGELGSGAAALHAPPRAMLKASSPLKAAATTKIGCFSGVTALYGGISGGIYHCLNVRKNDSNAYDASSIAGNVLFAYGGGKVHSIPKVAGRWRLSRRACPYRPYRHFRRFMQNAVLYKK